jgi:hypothetical protein
MKYLKSVISIMAVASWSALFCACESDNIDPTETTGTNKKDTVYINSDTKMVTSYAKYPQGSIVWTHDTTLTASFEVPKNKSLYIEPGVTVTANSASDPKVEIVVLGNLYCMGAKAKPVDLVDDAAPWLRNSLGCVGSSLSDSFAVADKFPDQHCVICC